MTNEDKLRRIRELCDTFGYRFELRSGRPELVDKKVWGGWLRPRRIYVAIVSGETVAFTESAPDLTTVLIRSHRHLHDLWMTTQFGRWPRRGW